MKINRQKLTAEHMGLYEYTAPFIYEICRRNADKRNEIYHIVLRKKESIKNIQIYA